ncbi:alpha/beta hydrolase [Sphaerisporangium sp. TRM90804]|uniref:alpha/beta fold hydrolase n=1 Tax=Sphaerisporangium sp. TRM90804 TaxID=3031113 RepID=UPI00244B3448|nr:alpha/beta hydrolase [Sphaerisporangium sp. TRM90804]MDH2429116.1 alpha/beta hydrolase [Sphaerisporangium sp. TRM90804]
MATRYLETAGGRVAYEESGPAGGPLAVLVHGMGDTRATFRHLAPPMAAAGHRVAAMDVRGYGDSGTGWPDHGVAAIGADLLALVRHLGSPATVVAHSIGCASAVWAAAEAPDDVAGLVLIASFSGDTPIKGWMKAASRAVGRSPALWGMFLRSSYPSGAPADFDGYLRELRAGLRAPGGTAALRAQIEVSLSGVRARYAEARCPTVVVMGTADRDFADPAAEARLIASKVAGPADVRLVEGAGHYPHAEKPGPTAAAILAALDGRAAGRP